MQSIIEATRKRLAPLLSNGGAGSAPLLAHGGGAPAGQHTAAMHRATSGGIPRRNYQDLSWLVPISWL